MRIGAAVLIVAVAAQAAVAERAPVYPISRRSDVVDHRFGTDIADPWRWLENDIRQDPEVADWAARQNALTRGYLAGLPARSWFEQRIRLLTAHEHMGLPRKAGGAYFYIRSSALDKQARLWTRRGLQGKERLLLDPNAWSRDGSVALDPGLWEPTRDGRFLAFGVQDDGSDWRTLRVIETATGRLMPDMLRWAKDTTIAWDGNQGFFYSRFPAPPAGSEFVAPNFHQSLWYHVLGTPQDADREIFATPGRPEWNHRARATAGGRFVVITSTAGMSEKAEVRVIDLTARGPARWRPREVVSGRDHAWRLVDAIGSRLWFVTDWGAPRFRLVSVDLSRRASDWRTIIPEGRELLDNATLIGDRLVLTYLDDGARRAVLVDRRGRNAREIALSEIGTASGFRGQPGDAETFFSYSSFARPATIYRYDTASGAAQPFAEPDSDFDPARYRVEQRFATSRDGTRVPIYLVRRADIAAAGRPVPTLLYGYGGFDVAMNPGYSPARMAWLEAGGAFALASVRGGGEYGPAWHEAGSGARKQNSFDDFIAAGQWLIDNGITPRGGLAIQGASNGGLLVAAVVNERPDLFAAANPQVGVMDMLRFDRFTAGRYWVDEYGHPDIAADWKVLRAYSPYHNIRGGREYPAILVTTADTDDRVVPAHSFKYVAALQAAAIGPRPHLLRIETGAGHGPGKPADKAMAESADILAFLAKWTGLEPNPLPAGTGNLAR